MIKLKNSQYHFKTLQVPALIILSLVLLNCSHRLERHNEPEPAAPTTEQPTSTPSPQTSQPTVVVENIDVPKEIPQPEVQTAEVESESDDSNATLPPHLDITLEMNAHVEKWIKYFTEKDRERFQVFLNRGQTYREVVENVLKENDLPEELYYLAMIESGYQTSARSKAKAVGVWQFIQGTGKRYGLRIDRYIDERRDPIRATEAAAKYLRDLYNVFGSWHLAMGAYNSGEIRILRAIMKGRTRDFWELVDLGILPQETANYVPKFLAVVTIGKDPEKYGFKISDSTISYPDLEAVAIPSSISFKALSKHTGIPVSEIKDVNPHLIHQMTPPTGSSYEVWFTPEKAQLVSKNLESLKKLSKQRRSLADARDRDSNVIYRVRRGDTLSKIARKYKLSMGHLIRINNLKSTQINVGQRLRVQTKSYKRARLVKYRVQRGDNLTTIAKKFNTSVSKIMKQNRLRRSQILVGQTLVVPAP